MNDMLLSTLMTWSQLSAGEAAQHIQAEAAAKNDVVVRVDAARQTDTGKRKEKRPSRSACSMQRRTGGRKGGGGGWV